MSTNMGTKSEVVEMEVDSRVEDCSVSLNKSQLKTIQPEYYYMRVRMEFGSSPVRDDFLTKNLIKLCISSAVKKIFGEFGASAVVDVLQLYPEVREVVLRCRADFYVKLRSSLTLATSYESRDCRFHVLKASPILISLVCDSRLYQHKPNS